MKNLTRSKVVISALLTLGCLIFFLFFNIGIKYYNKENRGIASNENQQQKRKVNNIVTEGILKKTDTQNIKHSEKPTEKEQLLYGLLEGKYLEDSGAIKLKPQELGVDFKSSKEKLIEAFNKVYYPKLSIKKGLFTKDTEYRVDFEGDKKAIFKLNDQGKLTEILNIPKNN